MKRTEGYQSIEICTGFAARESRSRLTNARKPVAGRIGAAAALAAALTASVLLASGCAEAAGNTPPVASGLALHRSLDGFVSQGRRIRLDVIRAPGRDGPKPAVLLLHGSHGVREGALLHMQAKALAERGITAFIVHYFDGLGAVAQPARASPPLHAARERVIADALTHIRGLPYVDAKRIGLYGLSLGGFHALGLASRDQRVAAVANMVGAMPAPLMREGVSRMPPTLILHGDRDPVVPVGRAYELAQLLDRIGARYEMKIYRGEAHSFRPEAREDSLRQVAEFFARHLKA